MKRIARVTIAAVAFAGLVQAAAPPAAAQQGASQRAGAAAKNLDDIKMPPALKAAVLSGNAEAISQAIAALSGGDSAKAGDFANLVVKAAEQLFATDPKGGIQLAQVAVNAVKGNAVQQGAPQQTQDVITTAARLFINPIAQRVAPNETAQLAGLTVQASSTTNNSNLASTTAAQAVSVAEKIFANDPKGGIDLAQIAVNAVKATVVQQSSPQQTQDVITTAARLFINPIAQRVAPNETAQLAVSAIQASSTTNNAALASSTAAQAVAVAERMVAANPAAAVSIASSAMQSVRQDSVMTNAPQQSLTVTQTAARIIVNPEAQAANPEAAAAISNAVIQVVNNPVVIQNSPPEAREIVQRPVEVVAKPEAKPETRPVTQPLVVEPPRRETTSPS